MAASVEQRETDEQWAKRVIALQQQNDELRAMMETQRKALFESRGGPDQSLALQDSEARFRETQNRVATLSAALSKVTEEKASLERQMHMTGDGGAEAAEMDRLRDELASLTEVTTRKDRVIEEFQRRVETELATAQRAALDFQEQRDKAHIQAEHLRVDLTDKERRLVAFMNDRDESGALATLRHENEALRKRLASGAVPSSPGEAANPGEMRAEIWGLRQALEKSQEKAMQHADELAEIWSKNQHGEKIIVQLRWDLDAKKTEVHQMAAMQERLTFVQSQLATTGTKLATNNQTIEGLQAEVAKVTQEKNQTTIYLGQARESNQHLEQAVWEVGERNKALEERFGVVETEHRRAVVALQGEVARLEQDAKKREDGWSTKTRVAAEEYSKREDAWKAQSSGFEDQVGRLSRALNVKQEENVQTAAEGKESSAAVTALSERVSTISQQLHTRTGEATSARAEVDRLVLILRERDAQIQRGGQEVATLKQGLDTAKQQIQTQTEKIKKLEDALSSLKESSEKILSRAVVTEEQLETKTREGEQYVARIKALDLRLEQGAAQLKSKDDTLGKMASSRQTISEELNGRQAEIQEIRQAANQQIDALREDGDLLRSQMEESGVQLQVAHARILTLERRVRESDSDMASVKRDLETCAGEAERAEALQLRVLSLEEEVRRNLQVASLLEDKEMLLSDAVGKNEQLLDELAKTQAEGDVLRSEGAALREQLERLASHSDTLKSQASGKDEAMQFGEKMLALSREQAASLHALRVRVKEQEDLVAQRDEQMAVFRRQAGAEAEELRERVVALTDNNRALQAQYHGERGMEVSNKDRLQAQVSELQHQLIASVEMGQKHFNKIGEMRTRMQRTKASVVARIVGFWTHVSATSAFSAWAAQVVESKNERQFAIVREETEALQAGLRTARTAQAAAETSLEAQALREANEQASPMKPLPAAAVAAYASVPPLRPISQAGNGGVRPEQHYAPPPTWSTAQAPSNGAPVQEMQKPPPPAWSQAYGGYGDIMEVGPGEFVL